MSPFRRSTLVVCVDIDRVIVVPTARGACAGNARQLAGLDLRSGDAARALEPLRAMLAEPGWKGLEREILLSDRLAHYFVMERPEGIRTFHELQLALESRLQYLFEIRLADWVLRVDAKPFAPSFVACAIPRRLIVGLEAALCTGSSPRTSLRPYLLFELDRHARKLPATCWFGAAGRDYIGIVRVRDGHCQRVRIVAAPVPDARAALRLIERERMLLGEYERAEPLFFSGLFDEHGGADVVLLDGPGRDRRGRAAAFRRAMVEAQT